ncbi:MAG TPA: ABC transporter permease [Steroidobacteraceae bacterium]|nr:ABC transporter permease [Steroidobacteraceae bacterium]
MPRFVWALLNLLIASAFVVLLVVLPWWTEAVAVVLLAAWLLLTRSGRQAWSVTELGIATVPQRLGASSVVVVGIAGVVGVLVALLAMAQGFQSTLVDTGNDDSAIVLRAGSQTELNSVLGHDATVNIGDEPQVMRDAQGRPIASPELVVIASLPKKSSGLDANVEVRGIGQEAWALRPQARMVAGRRFTPGLREIIAGKRAVKEFKQTAIGSRLNLGGQPWTVVGEFDSGDEHDSELWADADVAASAYRRGDSRNSVTVRLKSPSQFAAFKAALTTDPRFKVDASTTSDYYSRQSEQLTHLIRILGTTVGVIMAIGAIFGALNTMYAAVATRTREIATLRALGFRGGPVVVSVLIETLLLAIAGGVIGAGLAWAIFDHYTASTLGANFSQVVFEFRVTPALLAGGLKWALAIGFVGGLFPAVRAAHMPVTDGLREL